MHRFFGPLFNLKIKILFVLSLAIFDAALLLCLFLYGCLLLLGFALFVKDDYFSLFDLALLFGFEGFVGCIGTFFGFFCFFFFLLM